MENGNYIKTLITNNRKNTFINSITKTMDFMPSAGVANNMSMLSNSPKLAKMFASFDLDALQPRGSNFE